MKPAPVSTEDLKEITLKWLGEETKEGKETKAPKSDLSETERAALVMLATGISPEIIKRSLGIQPQEFEDLVVEDISVKFICAVQDNLKLTVQERIANMANLAVATKYSLMVGGSEKVRESTSTFIIEQYMGKATQKIESKNLSITGNISDLTELDKQLEQATKRVQFLEARANALPVE